MMLAGADDYRLTTSAEQQTPAGLVDRIGEYLLGSGYVIEFPGDTPAAVIIAACLAATHPTP
ncbi:hypothetical protein ACIOJ9_34680 [Streptomyces sp. NPDC088175]|uniref:hypothetical protein n=1 Tax=unclassified Streptomyces TaxID=2593676 RepID=UPI0038233F09